MKVYDLAYGADGAHSYHPELDQPVDLELGATAERAGWVGGDGPGIAADCWPRNPVTGTPMVHILTLKLPADYQRRGPEFPAISFYAGEGQFASDLDQVEPDADSDDPFVAQIAKARPHPQFRLLTDVIEGLLWLTEEEFAGRTAVPEDVREEGEHTNEEDEGVNAWDDGFDEVALWLVERDDPNAGLVPEEFGDSEYDSKWWEDEDGPLMQASGRSHLGVHAEGRTGCRMD